VKSEAAFKIIAAVFLLALWPTSIPAAAAQTDQLVINGDGSTFAYPMYSKWIDQYRKDNPAVHFTYVSNGSGAGIHDIMLGTVDFAGTDGPLNKLLPTIAQAISGTPTFLSFRTE
jgi:phosphate transport system substrate-binding protein